jgi:transcriptional/translational regulatory protein YebC/TACO1
MSDMTDMLTREHEDIEKCFDHMKKLMDEDFFSKMAEKMRMHARNEKERLHPALFMLPDGEHLVAEELEDHAKMEEMLDDLEDCKKECMSMMLELMHCMELHMAHEEQVLFPEVH